jgi:hypothetical protein
MYGKIKLVLKKRALELPEQKSSCPTYFFCHPQIVPAEVSQEQQEKYGDKTIMVPRLQANKNMAGRK